MTDRKLLELAAKAAGIDLSAADWGGERDGFYWVIYDQPGRVDYWNPLTDDGDALRLAVKCGISVLQFPACIGTGWPQNGLPARLIGFDPPYEDISSGQDVLAATRRAIVRAAAAIGKEMK
jgi:hypothetical protein